MAVVQCTVDSEPPAELTLSHDGKVLATSHGVHGLAQGTGHVHVARNALRLQVQDVPSGDEDSYVCMAHNFLGSVSTTGQLQAEGEQVRLGEKGLRCCGVGVYVKGGQLAWSDRYSPVQSDGRGTAPTAGGFLSDPTQILPRGSGSQRPADSPPPPGPWPAGVRVVAEPGLDVPEGAALNLSCHLPGGPRPMGNSTFAWFWNGRQLHLEPVPTLAFSYVARAQAGMYHCRAELPTGATTSAPVMLRVLCE